MADTGRVDTPPTLWTIGHSTRDWEVFLSMLREARIEVLADVRRFAGSRRNPQFSGDTMARTLPEAGIAYAPMPDLGGRRRPEPGSHNEAWRNAGFRGYADYMETDPWQAARDALEARASRERTAMMCAEAMWWQCHRSLIADVLKVHGVQVLHVGAAEAETPHPYTSAATIVDGELTYGGAQPALF